MNSLGQFLVVARLEHLSRAADELDAGRRALAEAVGVAVPR